MWDDSSVVKRKFLQPEGLRILELLAAPETELKRCMKLLRKGESDAAADWKIAIAARLKETMLCKNLWLSERLKMGTPAGVSRYCSELRVGNRPTAAKLLETLR